MSELFRRLGITPDEAERIIESAPSLRGVLVGYVAEGKLVERYFKNLKPEKPDDHNRAIKGDRTISYKGVRISIESKSLQTNSVRRVEGGWQGAFQCDASDSRIVKLPNGDSLKTVCLVVGGFDLLAVNLFEFGQKWRFAFVRNFDLPRSAFKRYTPEQRQYLLQTTPKITWPLKPPFELEPWPLLDRIVQEKVSRRP